ncbi:CHAD domain protein [bacterium BMS3Bbin12]|nr:CHAD domain protein [bacterium BMS3Abin12]GBE47704.1 CHAD domain protein [bacterium BMS3Bbin12]GBE49944.1 CHAD domain protein [bacterium BMS3Bbin13]
MNPDRPRRCAIEGARRRALALTGEVHDAAQRLRRGTDTEALHDFRVALRRLRGCLRAYAPWLEPGRKLMRRLRRLARTTNAARDAEVGLEWVRERLPTLEPREQPGARWLAAYLEARRSRGYRRARTRIRHCWPRLEARLRERLAAGATRTCVESLAAVSGALILSHADALERALVMRDAGAHDRQAHRARIRGKRLRYLLEPFCARMPGGIPAGVPGAAETVAALKSLQDELGDLQDTRTLLDMLRTATPDAAAAYGRRVVEIALGAGTETQLRLARHDDPLPGLLALARAAAARRAERRAALRAHGTHRDLIDAARGVAARLTTFDTAPALRAVSRND